LINPLAENQSVGHRSFFIQPDRKKTIPPSASMTPEARVQGFQPGKSVGREKDVQVTDLNSVMKKCDVTLLVMSTFFI